MNNMPLYLSKEIITDSDDSESQSSGRESLEPRTKAKKSDPQKGSRLSISNQTSSSAVRHISASESSASGSEAEAPVRKAPESGNTYDK
jgi:hypothetical protein